MNSAPAPTAEFQTLEGDRSRVVGALHFTTVTALLHAGAAAIANGKASIIDLSGVIDSDSSGLALLIEWLSIARAERRPIHYQNVPAQLLQLARLSDVDELLTAQ